MDYGITAKEKKGDIYFYVYWSPLAIANRWDINAKVPAVAGIYEMYWMDDHKHLRLFSLGRTHYGGLRSELRRLTDPELCEKENFKKILEEKEVWFRYAPSNSKDDIADVVWFFMSTYFPEKPGVEPSGRYEKIFLTQSEPDKLIWVP